ncbi:hypothetical protein RJT34_23882 [Clitoria ternatea]|uniref:Uncharacterized protein n=1 Tax=Clitoria ternatea TaxID=43366 RepID=A0AAN9IHK0_CLITE
MILSCDVKPAYLYAGQRGSLGRITKVEITRVEEIAEDRVCREELVITRVRGRYAPNESLIFSPTPVPKDSSQEIKVA